MLPLPGIWSQSFCPTHFPWMWLSIQPQGSNEYLPHMLMMLKSWSPAQVSFLSSRLIYSTTNKIFIQIKFFLLHISQMFQFSPFPEPPLSLGHNYFPSRLLEQPPTAFPASHLAFLQGFSTMQPERSSLKCHFHLFIPLKKGFDSWFVSLCPQYKAQLFYTVERVIMYCVVFTVLFPTCCSEFFLLSPFQKPFPTLSILLQRHIACFQSTQNFPITMLINCTIIICLLICITRQTISPLKASTGPVLYTIISLVQNTTLTQK